MRWPKRYRNEFGQLIEGAPYSERDIRRPTELRTHDEKGDFPILVKQYDGLNEIILDHHPFDVVGWDGYFYPWAFNINDFEPIVGRMHQPPPVHQTFQGDGFVICSFCPRPYDFDPEAVPAPYNHSNVDSDEVLYYASSEFMSRKGIEFGSITHHPDGIPHGPHPGRAEACIGAKYTDELAVMMDTLPSAQGGEGGAARSRIRTTTSPGSTRSTRSSIRRPRDRSRQRGRRVRGSPAPMTNRCGPRADRVARQSHRLHPAHSRPTTGRRRGGRATFLRCIDGRSSIPRRSGPRSGGSAASSPTAARPTPWDDVVVGLDRMAPPDPKLGPRWFPGARLNFAENLLRFADDRDALVFWNERGRQRTLDLRRAGAGGRRGGGGAARRTACSPATGSRASCPTCPRP